MGLYWDFHWDVNWEFGGIQWDLVMGLRMEGGDMPLWWDCNGI